MRPSATPSAMARGTEAAEVLACRLTVEMTRLPSIPLAMAQGIADGRIKPGQLLLMEAMGGGLTWGAVVLRL